MNKLALKARAEKQAWRLARLMGTLQVRARIIRNWATVALGCIAGLNALVYLLAFVRPYNLLERYQSPFLDLYRLSQGDPQARWRLLWAFLALGALYWLGWRAARRADGRAAWLAVLGGTALSGMVLLFLYPFDAADIFDNIMHGRILGVYGANPFQQVASQFKSDPFYLYAAWRNTPSAYGPGWEGLAGGLARLAGDDIIANVLAFKLLGGAFLAASIGVVAAILRRMASDRALAGVVLLAWNPVILYETLGQGHNDMAMIFWVLAAAWALVHRRYVPGILALVIGGLFKFIPLLMLPTAALIAMRDLPDLRARLRFVISASTLALALMVLAYAPFWYGIEALGVERRQALFTTSVAATVYAGLQEMGGIAGLTPPVISHIAAILTALFALWQSARAWRDRTWLSFTRAAFNTLMFYLLLTCLWFQSWYAVWPLGLAALLPPGHAARLGALFGYAVLSKPLIFEPMWLWIRPLPPNAWRELRLGPAVLAVPWLYTLLMLWDTRRRQRASDRGLAID
jgi:hypothetical protein